MAVRSAEAEATNGGAMPRPEPIDFPPAEFIELSDQYPCPTCGKSAARFREISGGFLVCGSCGCSFSMNERGAAQPAVAADGASPRR